VAAAVGVAALWAQTLLGCRLAGIVALPFALGAAALAMLAEQRRLVLAAADGFPGAAPANASLSFSYRLPQIVLGALAMAGLARMFFAPPLQVPFPRVAGFRGLTALSAIFLSAYVCLHLRGSFRRARFGFLLASFAALALAATMRPVEVVFAIAAAVLLRILGGTTGELGALAVLLPLPAGAIPLAVVLFFLAALRRLRLLPVIAAAAGSGFCAAAALGLPTACASPALGVGLLAAAAAAAAPQEP
jgi:hypothetical protein